MTASKIVLGAASGAAGGAGLDVDEVFKTYLYNGTGSELSINNGLDLSGEGGSVWIKNRTSSGSNHHWFNTANGRALNLMPNQGTYQTSTSSQDFKSFNSNGFTLNATAWNTNINVNNQEYVSWAFRKAEKFHDIVTYTGTGSARTVSHNLGSVPGMIIVKGTNFEDDWVVYHRGVDSSAPEDYRMIFNDDTPRHNAPRFNDTAPTSTEFSVDSDTSVNGNGSTYVAYLFAHNDGDGDFGPSGDQDIIKCGSYTGAGSPYTGGSEINLGFEPQFVLIKSAAHTKNWVLIDNMRGWGAGTSGTQNWIYPNLADADNSGGQLAYLTSTGFKPYGSSFTNNTGTYIYMAIRRGPLAAPTDATKVFTADLSPNSNNPRFISGFPVDIGMQRRRSSSGVDGFAITSRLTQNKFLRTGSSNGDQSTSTMDMDYMNGFDDDGDTSTNFISYMLKREPNFCDVVVYSGTGSGAQNVTHNLGVVPEMMWIKVRSDTDNWTVYHSALGNTKRLMLNSSDEESSANAVYFNNTTPTSSVFTAGTLINASHTYIAYLFATCSGVSKVGSYTGNSTDGKQIDCGFSSGARFVLIKNTTVSNTNWLVFDTVRGIVAGNDPVLELSSTASEVSNTDYIDPYSSGFELTANAQVNYNGSTYIFYAIA